MLKNLGQHHDRRAFSPQLEQPRVTYAVLCFPRQNRSNSPLFWIKITERNIQAFLGENGRLRIFNQINEAREMAEIDGDRLSPEELNMFFVTLVVAGNETTRNAISHGLGLFLAIASLPILVHHAAKQGSAVDVVGATADEVTAVLEHLAVLGRMVQAREIECVHRLEARARLLSALLDVDPPLARRGQVLAQRQHDVARAARPRRRDRRARGVARRRAAGRRARRTRDGCESSTRGARARSLAVAGWLALTLGGLWQLPSASRAQAPDTYIPGFPGWAR